MALKELKHWETLPWMTLILSVTIWGIHLVGMLSGSTEVIRNLYGIRTGEYYSYFTHAFVHADMGHIIGNTIALLAFGTITELQVKWYWLAAGLLFGVFAGACAGMLFPVAMEKDSFERAVGFSAVTWGLTVLGIGVMVRHWGWEKGVFWTTVVIICLLMAALARDMQLGRLQDPNGMIAITILASCMPLSFLFWHRYSIWLCASIPLTWMLLVLTELVTANGSYTSAAGHSMGALVGAILLVPVLRDGRPTEKSLWLRDKVRRIGIAMWRGVQQAWRDAIAGHSPAS